MASVLAPAVASGQVLSPSLAPAVVLSCLCHCCSLRSSKKEIISPSLAPAVVSFACLPVCLSVCLPACLSVFLWLVKNLMVSLQGLGVGLRAWLLCLVWSCFLCLSEGWIVCRAEIGAVHSDCFGFSALWWASAWQAGTQT